MEIVPGAIQGAQGGALLTLPWEGCHTLRYRWRPWWLARKVTSTASLSMGVDALVERAAIGARLLDARVSLRTKVAANTVVFQAEVHLIDQGSVF
jgi:hypothetical protein